MIAMEVNVGLGIVMGTNSDGLRGARRHGRDP